MKLGNNHSVVLVAAVLLCVTGVSVFFITQNFNKGGESGEVAAKDDLTLPNVGEKKETPSGGDGQVGVGTIELDQEGSAPSFEDDTVKGVPGIPVPNLDRPIVFSAGSFTDKVIQDITAQIKEATANLKQNSGLFNDWMDLGLARKSIGDYEGAREIWEYAGLLRPKNSLSFSNLAVLYGYYLQNNTQAEKNFLQAIENEPLNPYHYLKVIDFYKEAMNDEAKVQHIRDKAASQGLTLE